MCIFLGGLVLFYQWRLPAGNARRVEARVVGLDSQIAEKHYLRQTETYATLVLPDGRFVKLLPPNDGMGCRQDDLIWVAEYDNRYRIESSDCRRPRTLSSAIYPICAVIRHKPSVPMQSHVNRLVLVLLAGKSFLALAINVDA